MTEKSRRNRLSRLDVATFDREVRGFLATEMDSTAFRGLEFDEAMAAGARRRLDGLPKRSTRPARALKVVRLAAAGIALAAAVTLAWPRLAGEIGLSYYPPGVTPVARADTRAGGAGPASDSAGDDSAGEAPAAKRAMSLAAPAPFAQGFRVEADPYPAAVGQGVSIQSDPGWDGTRVWLYVAPASDQELLLYDRKLPDDALLIGRARIGGGGEWSFEWTVPERLDRNGTVLDLRDQTYVLLVGVTDAGYLAATGMSMGPPRTLVVRPQPAVVGGELILEGAGYPPGREIRIDLLHDSAEGGTDFQAVIGRVTADADGRFTFRYTIPARLNWVYENNGGSPTDHWLELGREGQYHLQVLEVAPGQGPGPHLLKLVSIVAAP